MLYLFQDRSLKINRKSAGENSVSVGGGNSKRRWKEILYANLDVVIEVVHYTNL